MEKVNAFLKTYSPSVLRFSMTAVILWFGLQQFLYPDSWTAYVPDSAVAMTHLSASTLVFINAVFETTFGFLLAFGWQTRIVSLLLALHLLDIMWVVGYGEIGVRDFGLVMGTLTVFMNGPDLLCLQQGKLSVATVQV